MPRQGAGAASTTLRALGRRTRLLQLRPAVDKDRFKTAEEEVPRVPGATCWRAVQRLRGHVRLRRRKRTSSQLGESVYTGLIATSDGLHKEHGDGTRHKVDATEFNLDESVYDMPIAVVRTSSIRRPPRGGRPSGGNGDLRPR